MHVEATGVPEARIGTDKPVIGSINEYTHGNAFIVIKMKRNDLADLHSTVINGRADIQRAELGGMQDILFAGGVARDDRRRIQSGKRIFFSLAAPASAPMYGPSNSVLSSDTPESASRGRTTQKRLSAAVKLFGLFFQLYTHQNDKTDLH